MTESDLSASAAKIANEVLKGEYGGFAEDTYDEPEMESYAGWSSGKYMNKKKIMMVSGVVLGVVIVGAAITAGMRWWKKQKAKKASV